MKNLVMLIALIGLLSAFSCKRSCYKCEQYCAYCVNKSDSSIAFKVCATKGTNHFRIDSLRFVFQDSGYVCNILNDDANVCDKENSINSAVDYYKRKDYYCYPNQ